MKILRWLTVIFILSFPVFTTAQIVRYTVTVSTEALPLEKREQLRDMAQKLQQYLNTYQYSDDGEELYDFPVRATMQVVLERVTRDNTYSATLFASNGSDVQFVDNKWAFRHNQGDPILHDYHIFESLPKMLDFYAYMILAAELDKIEPFKGTKYYQKALGLAEQGQYSRERTGWQDQRRYEVAEVLREEHRPFREMIAYFNYALYLYGEDDPGHFEYAKEAIDRLETLSRKQIPITTQNYINRFFDAHSGNMAKLLLSGGDPTLYNKLSEIDPRHRNVYEDYKDKL